MGSGAYAERTRVPVGQSRADIERALKRYGADAFAYGVDGERAVVQFRAAGRHVRFDLSLAGLSEQQERQRWRALLLVVKAKLEAVQIGVETFEQAFMAHVVLPDGSTVAEWIEPQLKLAYESGAMPEMLPPARLALGKGGMS